MTIKGDSMKKSVAVNEIKAVLTFYIGCLALLLIISLILTLTKVTDISAVLGAVIGSIVAFLNFVLMAFTAEKTITCSTETRAKRFNQCSYALRYIGMFLILGALMYFKIINPITALLPLFVPKIAYTIKALKEKSEF